MSQRPSLGLAVALLALKVSDVLKMAAAAVLSLLAMSVVVRALLELLRQLEKALLQF